jgi:hypothetical protein
MSLDHPLLLAFEDQTLSPAAFPHREHLRVAWLYLRALPFAAAAPRFAESLRRFADAHGASAKYHETITWAYLVLVHERMQRDALGDAGDFDAFARDNPDLFDHKTGALAALYDEDTLKSDLARRVFILPRR